MRGLIFFITIVLGEHSIYYTSPLNAPKPILEYDETTKTNNLVHVIDVASNQEYSVKIALQSVHVTERSQNYIIRSGNIGNDVKINAVLSYNNLCQDGHFYGSFKINGVDRNDVATNLLCRIDYPEKCSNFHQDSYDYDENCTIFPEGFKSFEIKIPLAYIKRRIQHVCTSYTKDKVLNCLLFSSHFYSMAYDDYKRSFLSSLFQGNRFEFAAHTRNANSDLYKVYDLADKPIQTHSFDDESYIIVKLPSPVDQTNLVLKLELLFTFFKFRPALAYLSTGGVMESFLNDVAYDGETFGFELSNKFFEDYAGLDNIFFVFHVRDSDGDISFRVRSTAAFDFKTLQYTKLQLHSGRSSLFEFPKTECDPKCNRVDQETVIDNIVRTICNCSYHHDSDWITPKAKQSRILSSPTQSEKDVNAQKHKLMLSAVSLMLIFSAFLIGYMMYRIFSFKSCNSIASLRVTITVLLLTFCSVLLVILSTEGMTLNVCEGLIATLLVVTQTIVFLYMCLWAKVWFSFKQTKVEYYFFQSLALAALTSVAIFFQGNWCLHSGLACFYKPLNIFKTLIFYFLRIQRKLSTQVIVGSFLCR